MPLFPRHLTTELLAALGDTPIVVLHGARQTGKTTLLKQLAQHGYRADYVTLDSPATLAAARNDPVGFLAGFEAALMIDEVQRAPELILPMKADVDRDRRPGRFLLTGSAHVMQIPQLADAFVGRMELLSLWPLSQGEIAGTRESFIDAAFAPKLPQLHSTTTTSNPDSRTNLARRILPGGYPEALARKNARRRQWFEAYLNTVLLRDVRELSNIEGLNDLPRLIAAVAGRAGGLLNYADLGRDVGLNQVTTKRYLTLLRATFIIQTIRPWFTNRIKRVVKSEKLYVGDTGLLAHMLAATPDRFATDPKLAGMLLENFVALELLKQSAWSTERPSIWHFRDHRGYEVDFVLESSRGRKLVGIEVKLSHTLKPADARGLHVLADAAGDAFHRGIILYGGDQTLPFGHNLWALPISALWRLNAQPLP